jgi:ribosome-associated protein
VTGDNEIWNHDVLCVDQFLKLNSIVASGGQAKVMIQSGEVKVNGESETRRRRKLHEGCLCRINICRQPEARLEGVH